MSKERELLNKAIEMIQIVPLMASIGHAAPDFGSELILEIQELLAQPEQSNEPVVNSLAAELLHNKAWYQKGYGDAKQELKREPLSKDEIWKGIKAEHPISRSSFTLGVKFGEKEHGIGGGE